MSLPDHLLDDDGSECVECGRWIKRVAFGLCQYCRADAEDLYADEKISERKTRCDNGIL